MKIFLQSSWTVSSDELKAHFHCVPVVVLGSLITAETSAEYWSLHESLPVCIIHCLPVLWPGLPASRFRFVIRTRILQLLRVRFYYKYTWNMRWTCVRIRRRRMNQAFQRKYHSIHWSIFKSHVNTNVYMGISHLLNSQINASWEDIWKTAIQCIFPLDKSGKKLSSTGSRRWRDGKALTNCH